MIGNHAAIKAELDRLLKQVEQMDAHNKALDEAGRGVPLLVEHVINQATRDKTGL